MEDLTLIPICSVEPHVLITKSSYKKICSMCNKTSIKYRCYNCELMLCDICNHKINRLKSNHKINRLKSNHEIKLKSDKLVDWCVDYSIEEDHIYYRNLKTNSITDEYPLLVKPPKSPKNKQNRRGIIHCILQYFA